MKNVTEAMLKSTICLDLRKFIKLAATLTGDGCAADYDDYDGGLSFSDEAWKSLETYFDVKIESIHADNYENKCVWIAYEKTDNPLK